MNPRKIIPAQEVALLHRTVAALVPAMSSLQERYTSVGIKFLVSGAKAKGLQRYHGQNVDSCIMFFGIVITMVSCGALTKKFLIQTYVRVLVRRRRQHPLLSRHAIPRPSQIIPIALAVPA